MRRLAAKVRARSYRTLHRLAAKGFGPAIYLLGRKGRAIFDIGVISQAAESSFPLAPPSLQTRVAPNFGTTEISAETSTHPALQGHVFREAVVSVYSNQILTKDALLMPKQRFDERLRIPPNCDMFGFYNARYAVCDTRSHERLEKAVLLGGDGAFNWYHFVLECASKAHLLRQMPQEYQDYPVIVPKEAMTVPSFAALLKVLIPDRQFLCPEPGTARVGELIVLDEVSQGPYNLHRGYWPKVSDYWQHEDTLRSMFSELRSALSPADTQAVATRRIFIVRPETRRNYNQSALLEVAQRYGFEPYAPETLPLAAQAKIFAEASHVIGASGAAWTNMIFAPKPFKALTWIPSQYSEFCSYSMLANLMGHDLRYLTARTEWEIKSTSEAYMAPYQLSVTEFDAAVARLCGEA